MEIERLPEPPDRDACNRAQKRRRDLGSIRRFDKQLRSCKMSNVANAALATAARLKAANKAPRVKGAKTTRKTNGTGTRKSIIPFDRVAAMYTAGKSVAEISDALSLTRKKTRDGKKENPYPYYLVVGALTKLAAEGKIKRGTRAVKKADTK